jgi:hypothetical protein
MGMLGEWGSCLAGGGTDVGDCGVEGVLPEVIGLPSGDFVRQIRLGPPWSAAA